MTKLFDVITDEDDIFYAETAIWCNEHQYRLQEIEPIEKEVEEEYVEVSEDGSEKTHTKRVMKTFRQFQILPQPEITKEDKQRLMRNLRNQYLTQYVDPKQLVLIWNSLSEEEQQLYTNYRQYLLDYPQSKNWWNKEPMSLEAWSAKQES